MWEKRRETVSFPYIREPQGKGRYIIMFILKVNEKEYKIKFAYKPVLKKRILSRLAEVTKKMNTEGDETSLAGIEDLLLFIPELILVGLQRNHKDEFWYDYNTNEGFNEQLEKVDSIIDEYCDSEDSDMMELFSELQKELLEDGFLSSLFRQEQKRIKEVEDSLNPTEP